MKMDKTSESKIRKDENQYRKARKTILLLVNSYYIFRNKLGIPFISCRRNNSPSLGID